MDQSQLKATTSEIKERLIKALLRELSGYERRLVASEGIADEQDRAVAGADAQRRIDEVKAQLRIYGHAAVKPSERSEKRPAAASATR